MDTKQEAISKLRELKRINAQRLPAVYHRAQITDINTFTMHYIRDNRISLPKYHANKGMRNAPYKNITLNYPKS